MIQNPTPEFMEEVTEKQRVQMGTAITGSAPSASFGMPPSVLPASASGQSVPSGGVPSVLPTSVQSSAGLRTVISDVPTRAPSVLLGGVQPVPATEVSPMAPRLPMTGSIRTMQSVTRQPSIVPTTQPSAMRQIVGTERIRGLSGLSARPSTTGFAQRRRKQGPGIRLTGMKLY